MNDLKARIKMKLASGKIITHNYTFESKRHLDKWKKDLIGKKIHAISKTDARLYGGWEKTAKVISVQEIKSRIDKQRRINRLSNPLDKFILPS
jgi:hypothetical protein